VPAATINRAPEDRLSIFHIKRDTTLARVTTRSRLTRLTTSEGQQRVGQFHNRRHADSIKDDVGQFRASGVIMMQRFGRPEQKAEFLDGMITGTHRVGFGLTEPDHGSDATWLETRAERTADAG